MSPGDPTTRLVEASGESGLDHAWHSFRSYAADPADPLASTPPASGRPCTGGPDNP